MPPDLTVAESGMHTPALPNLTIWSEAATGLILPLASAVLFARRVGPALAQVGPLRR